MKKVFWSGVMLRYAVGILKREYNTNPIDRVIFDDPDLLLDLDIGRQRQTLIIGIINF